jgi:predicted RNA binding protein YcfA (HicA-like mRNA interferase family)
MAGSVPVLSGTQVVKALGRAGFSVVRVSGSHHVMRHADGRTVVVPVHPGRDMPKGTLRNVLGIIGMSVEELCSLL